MGTFTILEEPLDGLAEHVRIPITFTTSTVLVVRDGEPPALIERALPTPFTKDYDALEHPLTWPVLFDVRRWGLLVARIGDARVGGCVLAFDTPGLDLLDGRRDLVVPWDVRVSPLHRRAGVGRALVDAAVGWAERRGCALLRVETQDTNPAACRFYEANGFHLAQWVRGAYPALPDETQLLWERALSSDASLP